MLKNEHKLAWRDNIKTTSCSSVSWRTLVKKVLKKTSCSIIIIARKEITVQNVRTWRMKVGLTVDSTYRISVILSHLFCHGMNLSLNDESFALLHARLTPEVKRSDWKFVVQEKTFLHTCSREFRPLMGCVSVWPHTHTLLRSVLWCLLPTRRQW